MLGPTCQAGLSSQRLSLAPSPDFGAGLTGALDFRALEFGSELLAFEGEIQPALLHVRILRRPGKLSIFDRMLQQRHKLTVHARCSRRLCSWPSTRPLAEPSPPIAKPGLYPAMAGLILMIRSLHTKPQSAGTRPIDWNEGEDRSLLHDLHLSQEGSSMVTTVGTEDRLEDLLEDLIRLDFDAAEAYRAAIDRLEDASCRATMAQFRDDHLRHTRELGDLLARFGRTPPKEGDAKEMLTKGKVVIAGLIGDRAIITAMKSNEEDTVTAYDRAAKFHDAEQAVIEAIERAQADEHRHREWMVETLERTSC